METIEACIYKLTNVTTARVIKKQIRMIVRKRLKTTLRSNFLLNWTKSKIMQLGYIQMKY